ncbi:MAG TPA: O-antigen ligase family protein [Candidatus Binataceae bacterium]|nr:O-antigen ligase family protein [Candidatus Binataceae bacterium]
MRIISASNPLERPRHYQSRHKFVSAEGGNWYDRAFVTGVLLLVTLSPLPMGAVHPWAFIAIELLICALVFVWMAKTAFASPIQFQPALSNLRPIALPLGLFVGFAAFALVPLPPAMLRAISPATYTMYSRSLSGWPGQAPYAAMMRLPNRNAAQHLEVVLPTPQEAAKGAPIPRPHQSSLRPVNSPAIVPAESGASLRWRSLSLAPELTRELVLKLCAYSALFFVVLLYPFGPSMHAEAEKRFYRYVIIAVLATGLGVACLAILQRVFWNGKILWIFVPYDWGHALPDAMGRARGPFVNPDHFASYLNLVIPVAIAGVLFPTFVVRKQSGEPFRVFCAAVVLIASTALLLSLSRAGWIGAIVGVAALVYIAHFIPRAKRPAMLRLSWKIAVPAGAAMLAIVILTSSLFVGAQGRHQADVRIMETVSQHQSLHFRFDVWRNSIAMVRSFPIFGIGLGSFPDVFPHFQRAPWSWQAAREAHNDYLELLIGAGAVGFALLAWFFAAVITRLYRGLRALPPDVLPVGGALTAGMAAMAFQEFFDFNLQIPALAILLTLFLALAFRLVAATRLAEPAPQPAGLRRWAMPAGVSAAALAIAVVALGQPKVPYPYDLTTPKTAAQARALILAHPTSVAPHLWMVEAMGKRLPPAMRAQELATAVWLDPANPYARDQYAEALVWNGQPAAALDQVQESVFDSPYLATHYYLQRRLIAWLSPQERAAIERGLQHAIALDYRSAVWTLASFYDADHQYAKESVVLEQAAAAEGDPGARANLLVSAGTTAAWSGDPSRGEKDLRAAAALDPSSPDPYEYLATEIFAPHKHMDAARAAIEEGISNGADPYALELALAKAAEIAGDNPTLEKALREASNLRPSDPAPASRLAALYMREKRFDDAVLLMKRAADLHPDSADVLDRLGLAEEANYQFYAAGNDLARAAELAPHDAAIKSDYQEFQKKAAPAGGLSDAAVAAP